ncbi:MAG: acyl-CoA dehydrogenase family protein [Xanthobacteraceae bacterium]|jgi:alkylation response protein AidB-like acyl-CoA dehydrogenase
MPAPVIAFKRQETVERSARDIGRQASLRAAALDVDGAFPKEDVADLADSGLLAAPLPAEHGGFGLGTSPQGALRLAEVLRLIGWGSLALGRLYEGHVNALALIVRCGTPAQVARCALDVRAGRLFGVWNTEDSRGLRLRVRGDVRILDGGKIFASGAGFVERPVVTARDDGGDVFMVLPRLEQGERADLSGWHAHGMRASATGSIDLTGLEIGNDLILGAAGDYHRQPGFSAGAWRFAAVHLGGIERLLDELRDHLRLTGRGKDPHQLVRLGEAAMAAEAARMWVERAATLAEGGVAEAERVVAYVNLARLAVERTGLDMLERVHRSIGLAGFLRPHPVERVSRDLATYLRQPAPDRALTHAAAHVLACDRAAFDLWAER